MKTATIKNTSVEKSFSGSTVKVWGSRVLKGLFAVAMVGSSIGKLTHSEQLVQTMTHLGYPSYILEILGIAFLLGVVGIIQSKFQTLREWAYAGFTFGLLGAFASHLFAGDPLATAISPVVLLAVLFGAYALEKQVQGKES